MRLLPCHIQFCQSRQLALAKQRFSNRIVYKTISYTNTFFLVEWTSSGHLKMSVRSCFSCILYEFSWEMKKGDGKNG